MKEVGTALITLFLALIVVTQGGYDDNPELGNSTNPDANVTPSDTECLTFNNQTICYNDNNKSKVNLTQLTNQSTKLIS